MTVSEPRPLTQWPLRRLGAAAAAAHARLLAQPAGPLRWAASEEERQRSFWWVQLAINDAPVRLHVCARAFDQWSARVAGPQVPAALCSAGVAHGGAALWQGLSTALHTPVQFIEARAMNALTVPDDALAWQLPALGWHGVLYAGTDGAWQRLVDGLPDKPNASLGDGLMELPLQVCLGVGCSRLGRADFARLRRHCVVLLDEAGAVHRQRDLIRLGVTVLAGPNRRTVARAVWAGDALYRGADFVVINSGETPSPPSGADMNPTDSQITTDAQTPDSTPPPSRTAATAPQHQAPDLSEVEVDVRFEIGRMRWPLRQLVQWRVGQPVPMELALRDTPVTAWVHERCIASGRLVVIGERLGVRLDEVFAPRVKPAGNGNA
jgi:flagellar motor switch/type III secretory pathway protein FliN